MDLNPTKQHALLLLMQVSLGQGHKARLRQRLGKKAPIRPISGRDVQS